MVNDILLAPPAVNVNLSLVEAKITAAVPVMFPTEVKFPFTLFAPSKLFPHKVLAVCKVAAVVAFPDKAPIKVVAVNALVDAL